MAFCKKCGAQLDDDAVFCHLCGTPVPKTKASSPDSSHDIGKTIRRDGVVYGVVNLENLPAGHVIDERYEIKSKIGQGGFGAVYRVFDRKMNVDKAIKVIPDAISNDRRAMSNLHREAQTMIRLNHKNIVRVYDLHEEGSVKYIDMEFIDGKNLRDLLLDYPNQRLPEGEVKKLALQITEGLGYAHKQQVIHRDIKPQNIMLTKDGQIKLMDFGIAETLRTSMGMIQNTSTSGTLLYMSPEQLMGDSIRRTSDIYSLGATLYELLCGHPPFYSGDIQIQIQNKIPENIEHISDEMNAILQACLAKNSHERPQNCEILKKSIEKGTPRLSKAEKSLFLSGGQDNIIVVLDNIKDVSLDMVYVKGGTFQMGSTNGYNDEEPVHMVTVGDFYIGKHEVMQKQWKTIMGNNPSNWKGDNLPVEKVSWNEAQEFIHRLNAKTGGHFRLPTEAEWEYTARGGAKSRGYEYADSNNVDKVAWYRENSVKKTHPVGQKQSNELGLYDMSGNVWEWCQDWYGKNYYSISPINNPKGPSNGPYRVLRGGGWSTDASYTRVAYRGGYGPSGASSRMGFRLAWTR